MNKQELVNKIEILNKSHMVTIANSEKKRLIFDNEDTFKLFGINEAQGILNPFNDYTYKWLSCFFDDVLYYLKSHDDLSTISDDLPELIESQVSVYTHELLTWLSDYINNVSYMGDAISENEKLSFSELLMIAQYKAIEELYNNALSIVLEW